MKNKAAFLLLVVTWTGLGLVAPGQSVAQSLARPSGLHVQEIQLAQGRNQRTLSLHFSQSPDSVHAFALRSPARLVIDVGGEVERSASATYTASDALIRRVRVGSHPHHTRFVLDLKTSQLPPFSVEQQAHVVTAVLSEPDDSHDDAEQADGPQQGDAQVLLARIPEADSPRVPPRPAQAPVSPAPTILAKNVTQQAPPAPLRRAMPPAAAPQVTPDTAGPAQATPLPSPSKELRAAIPRKDPPLLLARIPEADSPRVPPRPAQAPVSPAPTILAKNVTQQAPPAPLRRATPPAATPHVTPDTAGSAQATPLPSPSKELRAAIPLKDPPLLLARVPEAGSPRVLPRPTQALVSPAPTVLEKNVAKKALPPRRATPPVAAPHVTPDTAGSAQATPLPSPSKELRAAIPLKDPPLLLARVPEAGSPRVLPRPTQAPVSPAPTILAKNVTQQAPPAPLRRATPPAAAPHVTPDTAGSAQATPLPSPSKELRAAIPLKDPPLLLARVPEAGSPRVLPRPTQAPVSPAPTILAKNVTQQAPPAPLRRATPPVATPHVTPDTAGSAQATPLPSPSKELRAAIPLKDPPPSAPLPPAAPAISSQDTPQPSPVPPTASQHLRQGYTLYNQGDLDGAIRQWRKAIHQAPTHAEAHYRIGVALQERGELAQAITAFREAARLNPADATIHIHLARACEAAGSTQDALAAYRKALQLVPTSAHVHHRVGHLLAAEGNLMGAMQAWRQTIQLQPDYAYAYVSLGRALGQAGQTGEALAAYERALRLDPRAPFGDEVRQQIARLRTAEP